jgi:putative ABC transport system substrate-binding protein
VNKRRTVVIALGASVIAIRLPAFAQRTAKVRRIGFVLVADEFLFAPWIVAFKQGMRELGYIDEKDYTTEVRTARGDVKQLPALAAELVALGVDVMIPASTAGTLAVRDATSVVPIVMVTVNDPVGTGLVTNLARPGGNITGFSNLSSELAVKRLELLREIAPSLRRVGFAHNPDSAADRRVLKLLADGVEKFHVRVIAVGLTFGQDMTVVFEGLKREKADAIIVSAGANLTRRAVIVEHAYRNRLPAIYANSAYMTDGGLMSYAADFAVQYRRAAIYVDKIFKGAKPGDLPIEQPTKFEMVVNMRTAKALGIKIPNSILVRADKVIE